MFFKVNNNRYLSESYLRSSTLMHAYFLIKNYPIRASEKILNDYITQQYKVSLKDMCVKLLLNLTFYKDDKGNLILLFKDPKYDKIARLITYGNGAIPGSNILQLSLNN